MNSLSYELSCVLYKKDVSIPLLKPEVAHMLIYAWRKEEIGLILYDFPSKMKIIKLTPKPPLRITAYTVFVADAKYVESK